MESYVQLERQFSPVPKSQEEAETDEILSIWGHVKPKTWNDLDSEFRCVILAEAGAGKTEELRQRARVLSNKGKPAFFICIEDIEADFYKAFDIGDEAQFQSWQQSAGEAWFFLDSVDEARLENPRDFEKALRLFAKSIKESAYRAHIYLSSRPYAWRPKEDRKLLDELLFLPAPQVGDGDEVVQQTERQSALTIYTMRPLDKDRVRRFCIAREANEVDQLLLEIERANLWGLAERPFDLEGILIKWAEDKALGGRLELLRHNIDKRLRDDHNSNRAQRQPLNLERARDGARRLAAAVLLTGQAGLNVPDAVPVKPGIEAESVLADWDPKDVRALLERGIFNDIIYGAVRFRHRDVRELLAAEWFEGLLQAGHSRHSVEALFFREHYGEKLVAPRLRPVLPWLILLDDEICRRALDIHPEIAVEGGDPSRLPLLVRRRILTDIVRRIVSDEDDRTARDNHAIARIANLDLSEDVQQLIHNYCDNDDAIFFLGRLVWQGEMESCIAPFVDIAVERSRGIYARIASARAVMTCGSVEQYQRMWQKLNESDAQLPRKLLAELVDGAKSDSSSIEYLLVSLGKLPPYERYKSSGLGSALHAFVERLPVGRAQEEIAKLLDGLSKYLDMQPYVERRECRVSEGYAWLLSPALHAVERLIDTRSAVVIGRSALSIMLMAPALRHWSEYDLGEHKGNLPTLVPDWPELNDALYWASIEQARTAKAENSSEPLNDDWSVSWLGHYWNFDTASLPRLLGYMRTRELQADRLVALSTAFRVYTQAERPIQILSNLQEVVATDDVLQHQLDILLNPPVSEVLRRQEEEHAEYLRGRNEKEMRDKQVRDTWIAELRANPDRVRNPPNLKPDEFTYDQYWLMCELRDHHSATDRLSNANWQALIPNFGDDVARAYRDAAVNRWRHYVPPLQSEGVNRDNQIPNKLIFAMAGLEIEATETTAFPHNLNESQVRHALRYITWELNGFPSWFELMYRAFPALVKDAVWQELRWELENAEPEKPMHYILSDVVYHAPWLHHAIAPDLLEWVHANPLRADTNRHYCLQILAKGGTDPAELAALASRQIAQTTGSDSISWWYALRVDCDPINGIPEVSQWLSGLDEDAATHAAQIFITALMGDRNMNDGGPSIGRFRTAEHLKSLYILMHRYIRAKEDINRADGGVYSPKLRDDAQDARNRLFNLISEIPGKASYSAIKQLIREHPEPDYRPWMIKRAYKRAEEDGDLEPWTAEQVSTFNFKQTITPVTHRQLFDLAVHRLHDLKNWVERGNDSPWETWQRANSETEMRKLIAGWLNQQCREQYRTAQEPELANSQRMDIWLDNTNVHSPMPIELKLLDKGWSGPKLCERLRNQLVGDYLREESAGCGVILLVSQKLDPQKRWKIGGRLVGLNELARALKLYWQDIADEFDGIEEIEVIVIDLAIRAQISNT
ncbi:MAG: hypothetical protein KKG03_03470 [Gammaproteobacteria bacterium]|nr:hypothetical protein [Sideroxydans sp.]MBU4150692.1 hypothetical protein [Gammaproteobacteria bacterium]